jgi:hypothetical protein
VCGMLTEMLGTADLRGKDEVLAGMSQKQHR